MEEYRDLFEDVQEWIVDVVEKLDTLAILVEQEIELALTN